MKQCNRSFIIENDNIVTPDKVLENASIKVTDGSIDEISEGYLNGIDKRLDARGMYVLPGMADLHDDDLEKEITPRNGAIFPFNMAIMERDKKLVVCGIITMYHSTSYSQTLEGVRNNLIASSIVREMKRLAPHPGVRTRVHARYEITSTEAPPFIGKLLDEGCIQILSVMDHELDKKEIYSEGG